VPLSAGSAWNTLKDYFEAQGESDIHGSRDAIRLAFRRGVIQDGETWMAMIISRTLTSHTYNEQMAERIATEILERYYPEYVKLKERLEALKERVS
jgi:nucleotidyltransferase substrate binding protein (TIGR01987 family)